MSAPESFRAPKGTKDLLPAEAARVRALIDTFADTMAGYGFGEIVTPIFEETAVFSRVGEATDVVTKEMFDLVPKGERGSNYALRPELTASVCRAFVQHRPPTPWKVYYSGPQFRYERPQAGRLRQFTQVGAEALGTLDPQLDVEVIAAAKRFYDRLGLKQVDLIINSLGDGQSRPTYIAALTEYLEANRAELSEQALQTLEKNPLRVLDSKREQDAAVVAAAPVLVDFLSEEASAHFEAVKAGLDRLGIQYSVAPRLVRGLDYYVRTAFEFTSGALAGAQNAVGGGGRYDGLVEALGGPETPGVGFALGVERILLACDAEGVFAGPGGGPDVFVIDMQGGDVATQLVDQLAAVQISTGRAYDARSAKAQFKAADKSGATLAVIVGEVEVANNTATIKDLKTGDQSVVARSELISEIRKQLQ